MDTKELIRKCNSVTLEEEEEDKVIFRGSMKKKGDKIATSCLEGKKFTTRGISHEGIRTTIQQA